MNSRPLKVYWINFEIYNHIRLTIYIKLDLKSMSKKIRTCHNTALTSHTTQLLSCERNPTMYKRGG